MKKDLKILKTNNITTSIINKNSKLIPFNKNENFVGNIKYLPSNSKEWRNKVYYYNNNSIKNLPVYNLNINNLLKGYFSLYPNHRYFSKKYISLRKNRNSLNKIYISRIETKHTNSKVFITMFLFNKEKKNFFIRLRNFSLLIKRIKNKKNVFFLGLIYKLKNIIYKKIKKLPLIYKLFIYIFIKNEYKNNLKLFYTNFIFIFINKFFKKQLLFFKRYRLKYNLYKYKLEDVFLYKLSFFIQKIYNKKIEFNIINLKSIILNSDTITQFVKLKLKREKSIPMKIIMSIINKVRIFKENPPLIKGFKLKEVDNSLLENKYIYTNINSLLKKNGLDFFFKKYYKDFYCYKNFSINKKDFLQFYNKFIKELKIKYIIKNMLYNTRFLKKKIIFNSIKYKNFNGLKLLVKGRLTKRYRADRAVYKIRWIGGLKNRDASFKKLPSVNFRGFLNSNIEYSIGVGKRRIGAFAVKGWISGK